MNKGNETYAAVAYDAALIELAALRAENEKLKAINQELVAVLEIYADKGNYYEHVHDCGYISNGRAAEYTYDCTEIGPDIAQVALEKAKNGSPVKNLELGL